MKMIQSDCVSTVKLPGKSLFGAASKIMALALACLAVLTVRAHAGKLYVPNFSFESPVAPTNLPYATPQIDEWEVNPQPADYNPATNSGTPWADLVGTFYNLPYPGNYIENLDGVQAAFLSALPGVGIFQDNNSIGGTNTVPDHAFNATYQVGMSYTLTVGLTGSTDEPLTPGTTIQLSLYYRDSATNIVTVAETNVVYDTNTFADLTELVDFSVQVPGVKATDPWAGQNIGIEILCTPTSALVGGFWDVDNVRLTEDVYVPNYSFESPAVPQTLPYATAEVDEWQETPQPADYNSSTNSGTPWSYLVGTFYNVPFPGSYISNIDGIQASFITSYPAVGLLQDYNTIGGTNSAPDHALNATYQVGKVYTLTVGLTGSTDAPLTQGTTLQLSLYYRDAASNIVTIGASTVTFDTNVFTNLTLLTDFSVSIPGVKPADPWAGQGIGIEIVSTTSLTNAGGYWDADNVRLVDTTALNLPAATVANGQVQLNVTGEPGTSYQILGTTDLTLPVAQWTSLGTVVNVTGNIVFTDNQTGLGQRFYTARQLGISKTGQ